jgi:hypothetical protein
MTPDESPTPPLGSRNTGPRQVFISYSSEDRVTAEKVCRLLERDELPCWIAPRDVVPGHDFAEQIIDAIESTRVMVLILSSNANASVFVRNEVERAISKGRVVVPVRIQDVQPSRALELFVSRSQWIDAWTPPLAARVHLLAVGLHGLLGLPEIPEDEAATAPPPPYPRPSLLQSLGRPVRGVLRQTSSRLRRLPLARLALVVPAVVLAAGTLFLGGRMLNSSGDGAGSTGPGSATSQPTAPPSPTTVRSADPAWAGLIAPTSVIAVGTGSSEITLTWTDNATLETGYRVRRWDGYNWSVPADGLPPNTTRYLDTGLQPNSTYQYLVCAFDSFGEQCGIEATANTTI